jgi:hypothetical protein
MDSYYADILGFSKGGMPPRNKKISVPQKVERE